MNFPVVVDRQWYRPAGRALLGLIVLTGVPAWGAERYLVRKDGTRIELRAATQEVAVVLRDGAAADKTAELLKSSGIGTVEDFEHAPLARIKRMRVADAKAVRHSLRAADPNVEEIRQVYYQAGSTAPLVSSGTINMRLRDGLSADAQAGLWSDYRLRVVEAVGLPDTFVVAPVDEEDDEVLRAQVLADDARVLWAEPNFRTPIALRQVAPTDEFYEFQWHLNNTRQLGGVDDADIDAPEAWSIATGEGIRLGMFDDACDVDHEDLADGYIGTGHNPTLPSTDNDFTDPRPFFTFFRNEAHGTSVMGLAAARANSLGVRGVAFDAEFTASRGLDDFLTNAQTASVFTFALEQNVDVHINSWGPAPGFVFPQIIADAIEEAFLNGRDPDGPDGPEPPRGMVIVFASGNEGSELDAGVEVATLPTVIGVGATTASDQLASYSNYGPEVDVLAPGGGFPGALMTTTDPSDDAHPNCNFGGFNFCFDLSDIDPAGNYTGLFSGTSAACPVAAGVAALVLSVNPRLTATDVRIILEQTAEPISPSQAQYNGITGRSLRYAYGRINALQAVLAAQQSLTNGGRTWPERVANVRVAGNRVLWQQNGDDLEFREPADAMNPGPSPLRTTDEFLVLESDREFGFIPEDGRCYDRDQQGCGDAELAELPDDVRVLAVGCGMVCGGTVSEGCAAGAENCVEYAATGAKKFFAVFARNTIGRYSFGVALDNEGGIADTGRLPPSAGADSGQPGAAQPGPQVTINVTPLAGVSPMTVRFSGNAVTDVPIDDTRTAWDFDIEDSITVDATTRTAQHTYVVPAGDRRTFLARLTMYDTNGNAGMAQIAIRVDGSSGGAGTLTGTVRILIGTPGTVGSDIDSGTAPLAVQLSVDTTGLTGTLQSVRWDLGDGTTASSLFVTHTYLNSSGSTLVLPINVTVTTVTSGGLTQSATASRTITILPGSGSGGSPEPNPIDGVGAVPGQGGGSSAICGLGMWPTLLVSWCVLPLLRRKR